ncbi:hypothetical protein Golob_004362, partial [Gossypium lobatum]|nr:hypothetical protein [Gossypium lobatum]
MKKKFEIQVTGKNLFLISFDSEEDLEMTLEGRPWLFRRQLIIFDRLVRNKKGLLSIEGGIRRVEATKTGKLGHRVKECEVIPLGEHEKGVDKFPYSDTGDAPVKEDVVGRDDAGNLVEKFSTLDQQRVECMDLEGGASDLDYEKQVVLDNVNTQFGLVSPIEENSKKPKKPSWKRIARGA